jgi:tetratricopeptide (TPR) repeat protein
MIAYPTFGSPSFNLVAKGLIALHRLIKEGKDESPEAEYIRDALDAPLSALNRTEKERAQWLSEDLYSVSEPVESTDSKEMTAQAQQELSEAFEARMSRDWDRALMLLRRWREHIPPVLLCDFRGSIWLNAGHPEIAAVFFGYASDKSPTNPRYLTLSLKALAESDLDVARNLARKILADDEKYAPVVVAQAADIGFKEARKITSAQAIHFFRSQIPILERNLAKIESDDTSAYRVSAYTMSASLLGFCYEFLGNAGAAVHSFSRGLLMDPDDQGLLIARGILQYGTSPRAISDFEQALVLGSSTIWPYLFLAHHFLITKRFDECRLQCEMGLRMQGSDTAKSQLQDWRAIAQAELGFSPDLVRAAFESAIRLDPSNDLTRRNQRAFEGSLKTAQTPSRTKWEERTEASVRRFGIVEGPSLEQRSLLAA